MSNVDNLVMRIDAAMAPKKRELNRERTSAALAASKAPEAALGGDRATS
jgi:DNA invertase Pin-like site-specific DNA recombinase